MIAKVFVLALLAVAGSASSPLSQDSSLVNYGEAVGMYLQAWKNILPCGYARDNIPALAPFRLDFLPFSYNNGEIQISGNVSGLRVSGLNNFEILNAYYDHTEHRYSFDILYPEVQVLGSFAVEGTITIAGLQIPVRHSVLINKKLTDWRFVGDYTFAESLTNPDGLRISDFNLNYYIGDVKYNMWDKFLDIAGNNFINDFLSSSCMLFNEEIQPYINQIYAKYILPSYNEQLSQLNLIQLTEYLLMQAEMWNSAGCTATN